MKEKIPNLNSKKQKKHLFSRYKDVTGELPNAELQFATWYVRHKYHVQNVLLTILGLWCVFAVLFGLWKWGDYLIFGLQQDQQIEQDLVNSPNFNILQNQWEAQPLQQKQIQVFQSDTFRYDFIAKLQNTNERFIAQVTYKFLSQAGETETKQALILPGQEVPIGVYGFESQAFPGNVRLDILDTSWMRIDAHVIKDPTSYREERLNIVPSNLEFLPATAQADRPTNQILFDLKNDSAYSYWTATFIVELLNGSSVVGYATLSVDQFRSGETRSIDFRSTIRPLSVTNIRLIPTMNIFDQNEFMPPGR